MGGRDLKKKVYVNRMFATRWQAREPGEGGFRVGFEIFWRFCQSVKRKGGTFVEEESFQGHRMRFSKPRAQGFTVASKSKRDRDCCWRVEKIHWRLGVWTTKHHVYKNLRWQRVDQVQSRPDTKKMEGSRHVRIYSWSRGWYVSDQPTFHRNKMADV